MQQEMPLGALAALIQGKLSDATKAGVVIRGVASLDSAGPEQLAFLWDPKYAQAALTSKAAAVVASEPLPGALAPVVVVADPQAAMLTLLGQVYAQQHPAPPPGVHPTAFVHPSAKLGPAVSVGPNAVVEAGVSLGEGTVVAGGAYLGLGVQAGRACVIHANATVLEHCVLGDRVVIWSGAVVGKDGFGFLQRGGKHVRIPQVGRVILEDDVEVGALSTVARGALDDTRVRRGAKIDDHCHVAHNCDIGEGALLIGYARMGGSVTLGRGAILAQDAAVGVGLSVGDGAIVGSGAKARYDSVAPGERVLGDPARPHMTMKRIEGSLPHLPEMRRRLKALERRVEAISGGAGGAE